MLMCCDHNPSKIDHVEACKRMMLDKDVCGGQVIMQTTMERCCSFEWNPTPTPTPKPKHNPSPTPNPNPKHNPSPTPDPEQVLLL